MRTSTRAWLAGAMIAVVTAMAVVSTAAVAGWKTFGSANATGHGFWGTANVSVESTTQSNPASIRFTVTGAKHEVNIYWDLFCWNEGNKWKYVTASGSFDATPPITKTITAIKVSRYDYCNLDVSVYNYDPGAIKLKLQAKYP